MQDISASLREIPWEGRNQEMDYFLIMGPFPQMTFPVIHYIIDGNRVIALIPNCLPDPTGGSAKYSFNVHVILHYAGNGQWSYEEDVYNPQRRKVSFLAGLKLVVQFLEVRFSFSQLHYA